MRCNESLAADVSVRQLLAFATVASTLSYAQSADLLHYTEQGVHAQVRRLERLLGYSLIQRDRSRGLRLTGEGSALLPSCLAALDDIDRMETVRRRWADAHRITVAASLLVGAFLLP